MHSEGQAVPSYRFANFSHFSMDVSVFYIRNTNQAWNGILPEVYIPVLVFILENKNARWAISGLRHCFSDTESCPQLFLGKNVQSVTQGPQHRVKIFSNLKD